MTVTYNKEIEDSHKTYILEYDGPRNDDIIKHITSQYEKDYLVSIKLRGDRMIIRVFPEQVDVSGGKEILLEDHGQGC
jgi:hypothetical protein